MDTATAIFNAKQRSDIVAAQLKENKKLTSRSQEVFNLALSQTTPHSPHTSPHQDDTMQSQLNEMSQTIANLTSRLNKLEVAPQSNTAISQSDTSRTRDNSRTTTSALADTTNRTTSATYHRDRPSRRDTAHHSSRERPRSPSRSQQRFSSHSNWEAPPPINPTVDYNAAPIQPADILLWSEHTLPTHEKPSARYLSRIYEVPRAMVEHNSRSSTFTTSWRRQRNTQLKALPGQLPHHLNTLQQGILAILATHLRTTSHLELGYSLAHVSNSTTPQNIWPVTCPLCDPSSCLQHDVSHFDFHLPMKLMAHMAHPSYRIRRTC